MNAWEYQAGSVGTCTVPAGSVLTHVRAESHSTNGALTIFGGASIPVDGASGVAAHLVFEINFQLSEDPTRPGQLMAPESVAGSTDIVFSNTESWFVGYLRR